MPETNITSEDRLVLEQLELRLKAILPPEYQDCYEDVQPVSMGSAGLKYDSEGKVAWNEIWATFCDLAMAGGPPHKGTLLQPGTPADIAAQHDRYQEVVEEICRGVHLVTGLPASPSPQLGWVRVHCQNPGMAGWLVRAIIMENVSAHAEGSSVDLPAGPAYRLEKEIKNVVTVIAKTCHYWLGHMEVEQQQDIADLFQHTEADAPLIQPDIIGTTHPDAAVIAQAIESRTGLRRSTHSYSNWLGIDCPSLHAAIWMMRALVVCNILGRRESATPFLPLNPATNPTGQATTQRFTRIKNLAKARGIL